MSREIKFGLLLVLGLTSVFGVMVYKRMHAPAALEAGTATETESEDSVADSDPELLTIPDRVVTAEGTAPSDTDPPVTPVVESKSTVKPGISEDDPFAAPVTTTPQPVRTPAKPVAADDPFAVVPARPVQEAPKKPAPISLPPDDPFATEVITTPATAKPAAPLSTRTPAKSSAVDDGDPFGSASVTPRPTSTLPAQTLRTPAPLSQPIHADDPFTTPALSVPERKEASAASTTVIERRPPMPVDLEALPTFSRPVTSGLAAGPTYTVEPSDNYWSISKKIYGTGRYFDALRKHNEGVIPDPQKMKPGIEIATPGASDLEARYPDLIPDLNAHRPANDVAMARPGTYITEAGDNFWAISKKVYGTGRYFQVLAEHNRGVIPEPQKMKAGTVVQTPPAEELQSLYAGLLSSAGGAVLATSSSTASDAEAPGFFIGPDDQPRYRVGPEDTLSGIAKSHLGRSSRWVQILEMNRDVLKDGNSLSLGTVLRLPGDASQVQAVGFDRAGR